MFLFFINKIIIYCYFYTHTYFLMHYLKKFNIYLKYNATM